MIGEIKQHKLAYFFLLVGILAFVFGFFTVWPNRAGQRLIIAGFSLFYFLWGMVTHVKSRRLNRQTFLEYLAVSLLVGVLLLLVTL